MGRIVAVTSGKGGTGKTSFTAGVGVALAKQRKKVLCVDMDVGLKNLDLSLGMSDLAIMDFHDVVQGRCDLVQAAIAHPDFPNLYLLTAPLYPSGEITKEEMMPMIKSAGRLFDFVFLDAPAGVDKGFELATVGATSAVVVATNDASALRDARRAVEELSHVSKIHMVMNRIQPKIMKKLGETIDGAMDKVGLPLLGVVPEDPRVMMFANQGIPLPPEGKTGASKAYFNISQRMMGVPTPLMTIR